jgi:uncharacterized lipoprotein YbaY
LPKKLLVTGEVLFEKGARPFSGATVYIRLEDNSRADAASRIIAEQVVRDFSHKQKGGGVEFKLYGEPPEERADCNVRVHVDVDGDDEVSVGDYITMESYPVLTYGHPRHVSVTVREVD